MLETTNLCYCGHDCAKCVTYLATKKDDDNLREESREFYKKEFGQELPLSEFHCLGGRSEDVFVLCQECPFRKCCRERGIEACSSCAEYPCGMLADYQAKYVNRCNQVEGEPS